MALDSTLKDLVDFPREKLHVEYKSALDLKQDLHRANIARHICAIANHGGGYIVFGINDDYTPSGAANPYPFNHDDISNIIRKYLDPGIQCDCELIKSSVGNQHEIVVVPPHGSTPICAKANGPEVKGKVSGIRAGAHYIRKVGPESAPIVAAADWQPIIRRCALHERAAILAALGAVIDAKASAPSRDLDKELSIWAEGTVSFFRSQVKADTPFDVTNNRVLFSYLIETEGFHGAPAIRFQEFLREISFEVEPSVRSGWGMFYIFDRSPIAPSWATDPASGVGYQDFLQVSMLTEKDTFGLDVWRISPAGLVALVREYWEDALPERPAKTFDPYIQTRALGELVLHAISFAERLPNALNIHFRCEWIGLHGRTVFSPGLPFFSARPAQSDKVVVTGRWPAGTVRANFDQIVAELAARVGRAFNLDITPQYVQGNRPRWPNPS